MKNKNVDLMDNCYAITHKLHIATTNFSISLSKKAVKLDSLVYMCKNILNLT